MSMVYQQAVNSKAIVIREQMSRSGYHTISKLFSMKLNYPGIAVEHVFSWRMVAQVQPLGTAFSPFLDSVRWPKTRGACYN